jgi:hypothetical protein
MLDYIIAVGFFVAGYWLTKDQKTNAKGGQKLLLGLFVLYFLSDTITGIYGIGAKILFGLFLSVGVKIFIIGAIIGLIVKILKNH